jgi:hypothetical protein
VTGGRRGGGKQIELHGFPAREERRRAAMLERARAEHLAYHGPGPTFGELAIGDRFRWAAPLNDGPVMTKADADFYTWDRGSGTAQDYYRVERA